MATALLVLGAITRFRGAPPDPKFGWSLLAWSVLIDVDHLPQEFGTSVLTEGTPRPYLHALWVLGLLILATLGARYWSRHAKTPAAVAATQILAGMVCGIAVHFLRDVATAPMSLWWPVTKAAVQERTGNTELVKEAPVSQRNVYQHAGRTEELCIGIALL